MNTTTLQRDQDYVFNANNRLAAVLLLGFLLGVAWSVAGAQQLAGSTTITGQVEDSTGSVIIGARITLRDPAGNLVASTTTNSEGQFSLPGVTPGQYVLQAENKGFEKLRRDVSVSATTTPVGQPLRITMQVESVRQTVSVTDSGAYIVPDATTATKSDAPIRDLPQAIEIRTRQMLDDLGGTQTSYEVAKTVAGVFNASNGQGDPGRNVPSFAMRGYSSASYLKNGHTVNGWMSTIDMANIERVEFLKGPASVLYGGTTYGGEIGGVVNYVSKHPRDSSIATADLTVGSDQFYRGTADFGGALGHQGAVLWRLNGAAEWGGSYRDYAKHNTQLIAPAVTFKISPKDVLTVLIDAVHSYEIPEQGLPISSESLSIPRSRNFIDPAFAHTNIQAQSFSVLYEHHFTDSWRATLDANFSRSRTDSFGSSLNYTAGGGTTLDGTHWKFDEDQPSVDLRLDGRFHTGPVLHDLLVGYNLLRNRYDANSEFGWGGPSIDVPGDTLATLAIPAAGTLRTQYLSTTPDPGNFLWHSNADAIYVQDLLAVGHGFKVLAGVRYDHFTDHFLLSGSFGEYVDLPRNSHASPRIGLVYQPTGTLSLYAVTAEAFTPNTGLTLSGAVPPPELGRLGELGAKWDASNKLRVDLAVYTLKRSNMAFSDPADPTGNAVLVAGETKSHGVELDINGAVGHHLRLNIAAAVMNGWISGGEPSGSLVVGQEFAGIPHRTLNLFAIYSLGGKAGWEFGGGPYYASSPWADDANTFRVPSILQFDAFAARRIGERTHLQINIKNLANRRNYTSNGWGWIFPGASASVFATLRHDF
ncbi:MAG TPA: TonB-dependent receptor [Candidatus Sulfotelmatobacter sp.]|nr:TonB-dependent receptor [Candidatus Sulfotelmatobacter sp.]